MEPLQALLIGVVAPGALTLLLVVALRRPWAKTALPLPGAAALGIAAGFALGFALILGWPGLPPVDVTQVAPWVVLALAPLGFVAAPRMRGFATGLLGLTVGVFLAAPLYGGEPGLLIAFAVLITLTFVVLERGLDRALEQTDPRGGALATTVLAAGAAAAILFADTASLAQVTGGLAAATGALFTLGLWRKEAAQVRRAAPVIAGILATNLWSASLYANGRYEAIALIALAPLALALLSPWAAAPAWRAIARPVALVTLPVALAAALAGTTYFGHDEVAAASTPSIEVPASGATPADQPVDGDDPGYGY